MSTIAASRAWTSPSAAVNDTVLLTAILVGVGLPLFLMLPVGEEAPASVIVFSIVTGLVMLVGA